MKIAVIIPTLNAMRRGFWTEVLAAVDGQSLRPDLKLVLDSSSNDQTRALAAAHGWRAIRLARKRFNHGATRTRVVKALAKLGYDAVVFLSQDVVLSTMDSLKALTDFLAGNDVVGCYGKQVSRHEGSYNAWQRERCYSDVSCVKSREDIKHLKLRTVFFSNAFSAWRIADVLKLGGFPTTNFGEDLLLAAKVINAGRSVGYCAQAIAFHDHDNGIFELFGRGFANGRFYAHNREFLSQFGPPSSCIGPSGVPLRCYLQFTVKGIGFAIGSLCISIQKLL